jgi:glutamate---cysteine ligase / carboxylate-amine ligase
VRTFGVEEELLLIDPDSGAITPRVPELLSLDTRTLPGLELVAELQLEQVEVITPVHTDLKELAADIVAGRSLADGLARRLGARVAALATPVLPFTPHLSTVSRVQTMTERFGITAQEQLTCACHVHVGVSSPEEGVAVLDRIRNWLPVLSALSANSPFWQGVDTGYASYRTQSLYRWPMGGPAEIYGSADSYRQGVEAMLGTGVPLDEAMLYLDARLSRSYPTVEIRVADVCLHPDDTVLIAALCRALVDTAAREWRSGVLPVPVPAAVLRLAAWRASKSGITGELLDPVTATALPAGVVLEQLLHHVRSALAENGDEEHAGVLLDRLLRRGTGAQQQRLARQQGKGLQGVVTAAIGMSHSASSLLGDAAKPRGPRSE